MFADYETLKEKLTEHIAVAIITTGGIVASVVLGVTPLGPRGAASIARLVKGADIQWLSEVIRATAVLFTAALAVLGALIYRARVKSRAYRRARSDSSEAASKLIPMVCGPAIVLEKSTKAYVGKNGNEDTLECTLVLQRTPTISSVVRGWKLKVSCTSDLWLTGRKRRVPIVQCEQGGAVALLVNADPKAPEWLLLLEQPLGESPTSLRFQMNFPGFWNELRSTGEDFFRYKKGDLESEARVYRTEIRIPINLGEFKWQEEKPLQSNVKLNRQMDPQKPEQVLTLEIQNPTADAEYWLQKGKK